MAYLWDVKRMDKRCLCPVTPAWPRSSEFTQRQRGNSLDRYFAVRRGWSCRAYSPPSRFVRAGLILRPARTNDLARPADPIGQR
jgi:hypothetical protein